MRFRFNPLTASVGIVLTLGVLLLLVGMAVVFNESHRMLRIEEMRMSSTAALRATRDLYEDLQDMHVSYLSYNLSSDRAYLAPYYAAEKRFTQRVQAMRAVEETHPHLRSQLLKLEDLAKRKEAAFRRGLRSNPWNDGILPPQDTALLLEFRNAMQELFDKLWHERQALQDEAQWRIRRAQYGFAALAIATASLVAAAFALMYLHQRRLREVSSRLAVEATHDALTGLPNRRYLIDWMDRALALAERRREPVSVMYVDLDGFKAINDVLGHAAGDKTLTAVAKALSESTRGADFVARVGGDEFVIVAAGANHVEHLEEIAARVTHAVRHLQLEDSASLDLGATIGIASYPKDGRDTQELLHAADSVMYAAKRTGKGGWKFAGEEAAQPA